jgi:D-alanine-D-alanine ligase
MVLMGGRSSEHAISLASAQSVVEALDPERYDVVPVEIGRDGRWALPSGNGGAPAAIGSASHVPVSGTGTGPAETLPVPARSPAVLSRLAEVEVVLPILHGPFGEDGTVQGLLELADVAYVGAGHGASYVCMDKDVFKSVMRDKGIPVTRSVTLREGEEVRNPFGYPVFVKPAQLGSSIGITKVREEAELAPAVELALRHGEKALVEEFVEGIEIEVGVLGNREPVASLPGQVVANYADWYDYSSKYDEGGSDLLVPPPGVTEEQIARAQSLAVDAFRAADVEGMVRADRFVRASDGEALVNERNTIPGFTSTSFYARLFEASGVPYRTLLDRLVELAIERHERRKRYLF